MLIFILNRTGQNRPYSINCFTTVCGGDWSRVWYLICVILCNLRLCGDIMKVKSLTIFCERLNQTGVLHEHVRHKLIWSLWDVSNIMRVDDVISLSVHFCFCHIFCESLLVTRISTEKHTAVTHTVYGITRDTLCCYHSIHYKNKQTKTLL